MPTVTLERETQFAGEHPATLRVFDGAGALAAHLSRVDGDTVAPIRRGHPALGWEGDARLQMYWDSALRRHTLVRLERDGQYRAVCSSPADTLLNEEWINRLIARLVSTDVRRGFDPKVSADTHNARLDAEFDRVRHDKHENMADKLRWALKRDGAHNYC